MNRVIERPWWRLHIETEACGTLCRRWKPLKIGTQLGIEYTWGLWCPEVTSGWTFNAKSTCAQVAQGAEIPNQSHMIQSMWCQVEHLWSPQDQNSRRDRLFFVISNPIKVLYWTIQPVGALCLEEFKLQVVGMEVSVLEQSRDPTRLSILKNNQLKPTSISSSPDSRKYFGRTFWMSVLSVTCSILFLGNSKEKSQRPPLRQINFPQSYTFFNHTKSLINEGWLLRFPQRSLRHGTSVISLSYFVITPSQPLEHFVKSDLNRSFLGREFAPIGLW